MVIPMNVIQCNYLGPSNVHSIVYSLCTYSFHSAEALCTTMRNVAFFKQVVLQKGF